MTHELIRARGRMVALTGNTSRAHTMEDLSVYDVTPEPDDVCIIEELRPGRGGDVS